MKQGILRHPQSEFAGPYSMPEDQALEEDRFRQTMKAFPGSDFAVNYNLLSLSDPDIVMRTLSLTGFSPEVDDGGTEYDANGGLPLEAAVMVAGLYILTGAQTVSERTIDEDGRHEVIRRGTYDDREIFFMERTHTRENEHGAYQKSKMFLRLLSPEEAEREIESAAQTGLQQTAHN